MPQKKRTKEVRDSTLELAEYLDEDPQEIETQAKELEIEDPAEAEKSQ